jgi:hypothetical protein
VPDSDPQAFFAHLRLLNAPFINDLNNTLKLLGIILVLLIAVIAINGFLKVKLCVTPASEVPVPMLHIPIVEN